MVHTDVSESSSHVRSVGYDPITKTMEVRFQNGYLYRGKVSQDHHAAMLASDSIGTYYHKHIKDSMSRVIGG